MPTVADVHHSVPQEPLATSLTRWARRSGSTGFVLTGALRKVGRLDLVDDLVAAMAGESTHHGEQI